MAPDVLQLPTLIGCTVYFTTYWNPWQSSYITGIEDYLQDEKLQKAYHILEDFELPIYRETTLYFGSWQSSRVHHNRSSSRSSIPWFCHCCFICGAFFLCSSFLHLVCSALLNRWLVSCLSSILRLPLLLFNTKLKLSINNGITSTTQKHIANCNNYLSFFIQTKGMHPTLGISIKKSVVHSKCPQK